MKLHEPLPLSEISLDTINIQEELEMPWFRNWWLSSSNFRCPSENDCWEWKWQNWGYRSTAWDKQTCLNSTCNLFRPCLHFKSFFFYLRFGQILLPFPTTLASNFSYFFPSLKNSSVLLGRNWCAEQTVMASGRVKPCTTVLPWQLLLGEMGLVESDFLQVFLLWWIDLQRSNNFHLKLFPQLGNFAEQFFCSVVLNKVFVLLATHVSDGMIMLRSLLPAFLWKISCSVVLYSVLLNEIQH